MNHCILLAEVIQEPQLRYTSDTQTPIAELIVQFPGLRPDDPASTVKVVGWGNLAQEIQATYHMGDRVVIEGRLSMNTLDRPEGFKEKRAELTAQRIHPLGADVPMAAAPAASPAAANPAASGVPTPAPTPTASSAASSAAWQPDSTAPAKPKATKSKAPAKATPEADYDDIPF
jgi:single-strand DNA-binding protein